ncbi:hypothetical protein Q8A67_010018 [Cirrhinus molitorella]|uniref:Uncharacterized protein n=1 Tax=Cirrhinus molitorella TaxID=172907 RepID=A0AA88PYN4_9TELE|nr:hypothetical protein Q8A67_010018 [Cirrhinus molitorella]
MESLPPEISDDRSVLKTIYVRNLWSCFAEMVGSIFALQYARPQKSQYCFCRVGHRRTMEFHIWKHKVCLQVHFQSLMSYVVLFTATQTQVGSLKQAFTS